MKEKYFPPTILNPNNFALSTTEKGNNFPVLDNILAAVTKKILSTLIVGNAALSASMRRVFGAMNFGKNNLTLAERKF